MAKVRLTGNLNHNGETYLKGTVFEGDQSLIDELIAVGTGADPELFDQESTGTAVEDAEAQAKAKAQELVKAAEEQASKLVADAKAEAEKIVKAAAAKPAPPAPSK